jgi:structure-specific endonuclease subunit SLX1
MKTRQDSLMVKKKVLPESFYACYMLLSLAPRAKDRVYVGSTPNPFRRIRQHNGEIVGGAKKTLKWRPWEMVTLVHGFPNRTAALQFEWVWQHPEQSRHFKVNGQSIFKGTKKEKMLHGKLRVLSYMLHTEPFSRWPLQIHFCSEQIHTLFQEHDAPPKHLRVTMGTLECLSVENAVATVPEGHLCAICEEEIEKNLHDDWLHCSQRKCTMISHLLCLSQEFLRQQSDHKHLVPIQGACPICKNDLKWGKLIESMKLRRSRQSSPTRNRATKPSDSQKTSIIPLVISSDESDSDTEEIVAIEEHANWSTIVWNTREPPKVEDPRSPQVLIISDSLRHVTSSMEILTID